MPFPSDEAITASASEVLGFFHQAFGPHPGYRPAHAKGKLIQGTFTPTSEAKALCKAPHFQAASTPILARFSDSTGIPAIPDNDPNSKPHGLAVRFNLGSKDGKRWHTDVIGHSTPHFPAQNGKQFGEFLMAIGSSPAGTPRPTPVELFLGQYPAALRFVQAPKPFPASFATENYYGLNAYKLVGPGGEETFVRYQFLADAGCRAISDEDAASKGADYLFEEITERVKRDEGSGGGVKFKVVAQIAESGDVTDDITNEWPNDRKLVQLGSLTLQRVVVDDAKQQQNLIFDPIPRVDGIEPSNDPILEFRAALYLLSGRERRAAA